MAQPPGRNAGLIPDGPKIRRIRVTQGIQIGKLAKQIGRHRESVGAVESTSRPISEVFAYQLANALGVKVKDILKDPGQLEDGAESEQELAS